MHNKSSLGATARLRALTESSPLHAGVFDQSGCTGSLKYTSSRFNEPAPNQCLLPLPPAYSGPPQGAVTWIKSSRIVPRCPPRQNKSPMPIATSADRTSAASIEELAVFQWWASEGEAVCGNLKWRRKARSLARSSSIFSASTSVRGGYLINPAFLGRRGGKHVG